MKTQALKVGPTGLFILSGTPTLANIKTANGLTGGGGGGLFNSAITGLTGGGSANLDGFALDGSGADFTVGDYIQFDISDTNATVDIPAGFCTYVVITNGDAVSKYGSDATNAPYIIRATDFIAGDAVWERR